MLKRNSYGDCTINTNHIRGCVKVDEPLKNWAMLDTVSGPGNRWFHKHSVVDFNGMDSDHLSRRLRKLMDQLVKKTNLLTTGA